TMLPSFTHRISMAPRTVELMFFFTYIASMVANLWRFASGIGYLLWARGAALRPCRALMMCKNRASARERERFFESRHRSLPMANDKTGQGGGGLKRLLWPRPTVRSFAGQFPYIAFHVIASDHPQGTVVDENAGRMAGLPRCVRYLVPLEPIGGVPHVIAVGLVPPLQDPQTAVEYCHIVVLPGCPCRGLDVTSPVDAVGRAPDVVEELSPGRTRRVIGAAAENPDSALE